ncbi:FmdB family zinc ribbon protein [Leucobacter sp. 7(1)]|uniref:FmdB family zinc ribbon protein n=1 Tax=Leucobacter sp. 7(1) TaxID=1255613 RepID=UPI000B35A165|nr:FmdB family zinc ribbon protein [Leucobacter sp. 7(1)]
MPNYRYTCAEGCQFDALFSMSEVPAQLDCRSCGASARRTITAPFLSAAGSSAYGLMDRAAATAHEPAVVSNLPSRGPGQATPVTRNPLHAKLPRP